MRWFLIAKRSLQCIRLGIRRKTKMLLNELTYLLDQGIEPGPFLVHDRSTTDEREKRTVSVFDSNSRCALASFNDNLDLTVVLFLRLENLAEGPDTIDLFRRWFIDCGVVLSC